MRGGHTEGSYGGYLNTTLQFIEAPQTVPCHLYRSKVNKLMKRGIALKCECGTRGSKVISKQTLKTMC